MATVKIFVAILGGVFAVLGAILTAIFVTTPEQRERKEKRAAKEHEANERELTKLLLAREKKRLKEERRAGK
ncbi:hypothetical protein MZK49_05555 [Ensifer sesbaniae]|uniref:hypothetical protein n=1 Tax=Ensifer sesbaniae TaxID=1214071 RepID=UPI002001822E|nr:hypothetical protein [Ensifer sesbaniae]